MDVEATQSIFLRTGQTLSSFSSSSQSYDLNLNNLLVSSNNYTKLLTSGVPNFEFIKVSGFTLTWYPSSIIPVTATFEPAAFDLRYFSSYSIASVLPSTFQGNYNETHYNVLLQQTSRPVTRVFALDQLPTYIVSESNRQCMGQIINAYNYTNYASQHGGIMTIIQSTPSTNTIALYNPKLGFIEVKYHLEIFNSVV
jgi:hypothetical protein